MTIFITILTAVLLAAADQITKSIASSKLSVGEAVNILKAGDTEILTFSHYHNTGAAFSSMQGQTVLLAAVTVVMMAALIWVIVKYKLNKLFPLICTAAIIGGGIGNLIDRIRLGYVVDFIILFPFDFIFNIADVGVVIGAILLCAYYIFCDKEKDEKNE